MYFNLIVNKRGVAILITLTIIALLIVTTLELNRQARSAVLSAATTRDRITLSEMTSSAVNFAMAMLIKDKEVSTIDSIQEDWADTEKIKELLNGFAFDEGSLNLSISDELGRIQVNALVEYPDVQNFNQPQRSLMDRFLRLALSSNETTEDIDPATTILNSMKDWLDSGDDDAITGLSGAESDYYEDLDPPYRCKNGMITHLSELILIKGIIPEVYYGSEETPGMSRYVTVNGMTDGGANTATFTGKININTAELPVLSALLPEENQDLAQAIFDHRLEKSGSVYTHDLSGKTWYKQVPGAGDIEINPELITTQSDIFKIETSAMLHDMKMSVTVVVHRLADPETGKYFGRVLSWEPK
jgi:general secretion pathway protein K